MNYKEKYLKYKLKYIKLQQMLGGINPSTSPCMLKDIFDLDCILPLTKNINEDYIFNKRISKDTINLIRTNIQNYYEYFYNYLMFPNLSGEELKRRDLRDEIMIPIINKEEIVNNKKLSVGIVNYNIIIKKLINTKIIEKAQTFNQLNNKLNELVNAYKDYIKSLNYKDYNITDNDITDIESYKDINILPKSSIGQKIFALYKEKYEEYNKKFNEYSEINKQYKKSIDDYNKLIPIFNKSIRSEQEKIQNDLNVIKQGWDTFVKKIEEKKSDYTQKLLLSESYIKIYNNITNNTNQINSQRGLIINYNINSDEEMLINDLIKYNNTNNVMSMIEEKKKDICKKILDNFNKNPDLNTQILSVDLNFFDSNENKLNMEEIGHANSVTIYRFKKNGNDAYLCLRTEPHRHTNIYCRNSVRKAIRDIFKYLVNSYYLDFIIDSKEGLQVNENIDIEKQNLTDFDDIPSNIQSLSPLQGNSGFCASWTIYVLFVLMMNRNNTLDKLGKYFADFNLKNSERQLISIFKHDLDKCFIDPTKIDSSCKSKQIFKEEFKKYIEYDSKTQRYIIPNETQQKNYKYILMKHIKLYRMIIFMVYFITRKLNISDLINNIQNVNDKKILNEIFNKLDDIDILNVLNNKLNIQNKIKIDISQEILDRDTHNCDDNLFDHTQFCNLDDIIKPIPNQDNYKCSVNKLKENNNIRLKGLKTTVNQKKMEQEKIVSDINYIFSKI